MINLLPKLSLGAVVLAIGFMAKVLAPHFEDPDFYWHIKTGEYLLLSWPLPGADVFTYTHTGSPWGLSEWLAQIVLYLVFTTTGYFGMAVWVAVLCAFCGWVTYLNCRKQMVNPVHAIIVAGVCSLFLITAAPRPYLFTFVFFSATLFVLLEFKYFRRDRLLALLPATQLLWANTHGGFFLGLVLVFLFAGSEWLRYRLKSEGALDAVRLRKLSLWAAVSLSITLVNPEFIQLWWYPIWGTLISGDVSTINEWQSPSFHVPITQGFLALVLFFFAVQARAKHRPDLTEIVVPLVFIAGAFVSVRNMPLAALALAPFLAISLGHRTCPATTGSRDSAAYQKPLADDHALLINWILLVVAGLALALSYPAQRKKQEAAVANYMPVGAADFLAANHISGRMFNSYQYGGYLVFRLYPAQQVFIYGKSIIYRDDRDDFIRIHDAILGGRSNWKALFDRYDIDYVVCESNVALRQLLLQEGRFRLVFDDGNHSVLLKDIDKFQAIIARHG
ncbi:MAG: hypothetical protein Q8L56_11840 [Rhodocyclaceae bacterium]|nr:hypothetical protein [Rhodocyclaceae bacterium]